MATPKMLRTIIKHLPRLTPHKKSRADRTRDQQMISMYRDGNTLEEIGAAFRLTRERVRQILSRNGLTRDSGGATVRAVRAGFTAMEARAARRHERYMKILGTPPNVVAELIGMDHANPWTKNTPTRAYLDQKRNAMKRGVGWQFNFAEWWHVWQESGKWAQRGRGAGYCMARNGDDGPYAPSNVYICTIGENFSDSYISTPSHKRNRKPVKGWTFMPRAKAKPYMAYCGQKYLGYFATPEEAHAAHVAAREARQ